MVVNAAQLASYSEVKQRLLTTCKYIIVQTKKKKFRWLLKAEYVINFKQFVCIVTYRASTPGELGFIHYPVKKYVLMIDD